VRTMSSSDNAAAVPLAGQTGAILEAPAAGVVKGGDTDGAGATDAEEGGYWRRAARRAAKAVRSSPVFTSLNNIFVTEVEPTPEATTPTVTTNPLAEVDVETAIPQKDEDGLFGVVTRQAGVRHGLAILPRHRHACGTLIS